jgi:hypothetical protein
VGDDDRKGARASGRAPRQRVDGEWSVVETLRHLVMAADCWLSRGIKLETRPYHLWGLPWSGISPELAAAMGVDLDASPSISEVLPVRRAHQQAVHETLDSLSDDELAEVRMAPDEPGHPSGEHSVLHCLHVLLDEEWEHHRYTVRDLDILNPGGAQ